MKTIVINPKERDDGRLPYPFFIDEAGNVGRQDFWRGQPLKLIGFNGSAENKTVEPAIGLEDFLENPHKCLGLYPIFEDDDEEWHTWRDPIESVTYL